MTREKTPCHLPMHELSIVHSFNPTLCSQYVSVNGYARKLECSLKNAVSEKKQLLFSCTVNYTVHLIQFQHFEHMYTAAKSCDRIFSPLVTGTSACQHSFDLNLPSFTYAELNAGRLNFRSCLYHHSLQPIC